MTIFMPISSKPRAACRVDGKALGIDFAASSNYKWLQGARGSGFLCVSEDCQGSVAKDLSFPGYVHFNYPRGRRNVIRPRTISRTSRPKAPAATRLVTSAMSPMPDNTAPKRILALGVNNIYAYTKPMCDRLKKELPALGYQLITPMDAVSSIIVRPRT